MMPASPSAWTGDRPPPGRRVGGIIALALMLGACGEAEPLDPAALGELCGAAGPFRLLPLTPDERPVPEASIVRVGERIVLAIGAGEPRRDSLRGPVPASTTVYALGPCGEDPVVIGRDIDRVFMVPQWPGVVLGCEAETDDLLRLDPTGAAAPERLASACEATWTPAGLIHVERTELQRVAATRPSPSSTPPRSRSAIRSRVSGWSSCRPSRCAACRRVGSSSAGSPMAAG